VVAEEHNIFGGLGGAVAESLSRSVPVPMEYVGVEDRFTESGPYDLLLKKYRISSEVITEKVRKVIARK
jgi:transketolase